MHEQLYYWAPLALGTLKLSPSHLFWVARATVQKMSPGLAQAAYTGTQSTTGPLVEVTITLVGTPHLQRASWHH